MKERIKPMQVHKNLVIYCLRQYPEELPKLVPSWTGTAEELIDELEADPHEWFIGGVLCDEQEGGSK